MADQELRGFYYHQPFQEDKHKFLDPSFNNLSEYLNGSSDYTSLGKHFGFSAQSPSSHEAFSSDIKPVVGGGSETPHTPNSSISSSSTEAAGDESSNKSIKKLDKQVKESLEDHDDGEDSCKKESKAKKKGEKKERQQKFAFMTKSEVDHLEDGYRWRKYGQKAVKNSPYPRSYYRCTSQKCGVKKRVERSFQDPSIVITTYEGQHNHHLPATLRGSVAGMLTPSMLTTPSPLIMAPQSFHDHHQELIMSQMPHQFYSRHGFGNPSNSSIFTNMYHQHHLTPSSSSSLDHDQKMQIHDYGLLQDMVPSMYPKQEL